MAIPVVAKELKDLPAVESLPVPALPFTPITHVSLVLPIAHRQTHSTVDQWRLAIVFCIVWGPGEIFFSKVVGRGEGHIYLETFSYTASDNIIIQYRYTGTV